MSIFTKLGDFITNKFGWIWNVGFLLVFAISAIVIPGFFAKVVFAIAFAGKVFEVYAWYTKQQ